MKMILNGNFFPPFFPFLHFQFSVLSFRVFCLSWVLIECDGLNWRSVAAVQKQSGLHWLSNQVVDEFTIYSIYDIIRCVFLRLKSHHNDASLSIWQKFRVSFCDFLFDMKLRKPFKVFTIYPSLSFTLAFPLFLSAYPHVYTVVIYAAKQVVIAIKFAFGFFFFWLKLISRVP